MPWGDLGQGQVSRAEQEDSAPLAPCRPSQGIRKARGDRSQLIHRQLSPFPVSPGTLASVLGRVGEPGLTAAPPYLSPESPLPQVLDVGDALTHGTQPTVPEEQVFLPPGCPAASPPLSSRTCWAEPASLTGAAVSGMSDSTSLPAGFFTALEVQVCEGSARLQLDADAEVAEAWAARSR